MAGRRSEQASARRLRQAQRQGQVPALADLRLVAWAVSLWLFVRFFAVDVFAGMRALLVEALAAIARNGSLVDLLRVVCTRLLTLLGLPLLMFAVAAALPALVRGGLALPTRGGLRNPIAGLYSGEQGLSLGMGAARSLLLLLLALQVVAALAPGLRSLGLYPEVAELMPSLFGSVRGLADRLLVAVLLVAPAGLWLERMLHRRGLRMTREERQRERLREELHPRMLGELRRRAGTEPAPNMVATHGIAHGTDLLLLAIDEEGQQPPRLVARAGVREASPDVRHLHVAPELARRLAQLSPGDSVPRACYPPLAQAVAALRTPSPESP